MRLLFIAALVASLVSLGAEPAEAISFSAPIRVINEKNEVRWASDGGTCLTPKGWSHVDNEFKNLQTKASEHRDEPSKAGWFFAGLGTGAGVTAIGAVVLFFVFKK